MTPHPAPEDRPAPDDAPDTPPASPGASRTAKAALLALGQGLNLLLGVALSSGLAWTLPDRDLYGAFQQVLLLYSILAGPLAVGLPNAVYHFLPRLDPPRQKGFLAAAHGVLFAAGAVLSAVLFFGADALAGALDSPLLAPLLRAWFPLPLFTLPQMLADPILVCQSRLPLMVGLQLATRAAAALGVLVPVWLGFDLSVGLFCWVLLGAALEALTVQQAFRPLRGVPAAWRPGLTREVVAFAAPIAAVTLLSPVALMADKVLVSGLFGAAAYAVYVNGTYALSLGYSLVLRAQAILLPDFSRLAHLGRRDEMAALWRRASFKTALVLFPVAAGVAAGAPDVVRVLFSDRYLDSVPVMRIAVLALLPRILLTSPALQGAGRSGWYASCTVVAALATPSLVILFGWALDGGVAGAAAGYLAGELVHGAWQVGLIRFVLGHRPGDVLPGRRLLALAAWAFLTAFATLGVLPWLAPAWPAVARLLVAGPLFGAAFAAGAVALRIADFDTDVAPLLRAVRVDPVRFRRRRQPGPASAGSSTSDRK